MLLGLCEKGNMLTNIHQRGHHWYLYYYSASYICMTHTHIPFLDGLFTSQTRNLEVLLLWRTTRAPVWTPGPGASFAPPLLFGYLPAVQTSPWSTEFDVRIESFGQWQKYQTVQTSEIWFYALSLGFTWGVLAATQMDWCVNFLCPVKKVHQQLMVVLLYPHQISSKHI